MHRLFLNLKILKNKKTFSKIFLQKSAVLPRIFDILKRFFFEKKGASPSPCVFLQILHQYIVYHEKFKKILKNSEKIRKKVLTFAKRCDILHERSKRERKNNGP